MPNFEILDLLLERDSALLFVGDRRGAKPLAYVAKGNYNSWKAYLSSRLDKFWPPLASGSPPPPPPSHVTEAPFSVVLPDVAPSSRIPPSVVRALCAGHLLLEQVEGQSPESILSIAADLEARGAL